MVYRLEECGYCGTPTWCEIRENGNPQCRGCKVERFFDRVLYKPIGFRLLPWQREILRTIYGTVQPADGLRQYRQSYISVAKKNGKSFLVGGLPIYHLLMEEELNPSAYGAAAAKDQASLVFRAAAELIRRNPMLSARLKVLDTTKRIVRKDGGGFYAVLSADGDIQDGIEPSLAIMDELHRWKAAKADTLYNVITKGTISRREPLVVQITTAGEINDSPICWREHEYATSVLNGSLQSDRFYPRIWQADQERVKTDPDFWKSREARVQANPSHEDLGGFLKDEAIVEELKKAEAVPAMRNAYLRYHLNNWVSAESRAISAEDWAKCAKPLRSLVGRVCYAGVDLSQTTDLTAVVLLFPDKDGTFDISAKFWMPEERVAERERYDRAPYSTWAHQGYLDLCPGASIDLAYIRRYIKWATEVYSVAEICYDPWGARHLVEGTEGLEAQGMICYKIPQNFARLSEPTKQLIALAGDGKIRHGSHPILDWNADCATAKTDGKDNLMFAKPDRLKSSKRIDGLAATVNALARALVALDQTPHFARTGKFLSL